MGNIALVTGASAGFGRAIVEHLIADGIKVIGASRRLEKLKALETSFGSDNFYPLQMDVTDTKAYEADFENWMTMINTNIVGLIYLTRQLLPHMVSKDDGIIINLGSTAGTIPYPGANIYGASKAFVKQFSLNLRADLAGSHIRVTNIEPGLCEGTEFSKVRFNGDEARVKAIYQGAHAIQPQDIASTVSWVIHQPPHVNVNRIELMPVSQSYGPQPVSRD
ncbi:short-chain dehydrogenase [Streptococcus pyogenes]|uniref:SDR family NAD(P)-dependent oxidoreductase n=1 Tax=Streptococcus pyogenes TaxID=1314 RepID=UPI00109C57A8|nr:SDR family NAD(P)-dependent oxidoreductase [Streptococcus pyogenes]VGU21493.1 short-chain dehydrogenase [Streptococcus pyogenes]HEP1515139.1 SDR family NAD(P)-dependent oxidoreductase [Streptococcus pyogenes]